MSQPQPGLHFTKKRLALAFTLAALADGLMLFLTFTPPLQWALDLVTALLLFMVLGWQWVMLPGLILEAIPGINIFPFWVLVVGAVAMLGTVRPNPKALLHAIQEVRKFFMQRLSGQAQRPPNLPGSKEVPVEIGSSHPKV
jgi:hypothetical protein